MQVDAAVVQVVRRAREVRTPGTRFTDVKRLIVARTDRLGDLVLTLPAVSAIRRCYPEAELALLVRPSLTPLARRVVGVDHVLEGVAMQAEIERFAPQLIVCISRDVSLARAAAAARVPRRVGTGYRIFSPLFTRGVREHRRRGSYHELEYALSFAHRVGADADDARFEIDLDTEAEPPDPPLSSSGYVVIHPGSGGSCPRWPVRHFIALAAMLTARGIEVVFSLGPEDGMCEEALDAARSRVRGLPRFFGGLRRLPPLLAAAGLVVSNSTGPLHLAAAVGTKTLGIYAPWPSCSPTRWGPYAENGWAVVADCNVALSWSRDERKCMGGQLLAAIHTEHIFEVATALLDGRDPRA